ncbi:MAG: lipopolysaccharide heptosyltransferase II [Calditrichota bacterium]
MARDINRVLIIRFSSLGDVLLATPLVRLLREKYPNSRIDFVVKLEYVELVRFNPNLTGVMEFDTKRGFPALRNLKKSINERKYDVILDLHHSLRSRYLTFGLAWNPFSRTTVYGIRKNQFIRFLLVKFKINLYRKIYGRIIPVWEKYISTAKILGIKKDDGHLEFYFPSEMDEKLVDKLEKWYNRDYVVMAPGAKHFTKRWPAKYFARLVLEIHRKYNLPTLFVGSEDDVSVVEEILSEVPGNVGHSLAGKLSILQTADLVRRAKLAVSNDSGLMHVAAALQKPLIAIFGSTVEELGFYPNSINARVLENSGLYCRPCSHIGRDSCPEKHFRCMREISPDQVMEKIKDILNAAD